MEIRESQVFNPPQPLSSVIGALRTSENAVDGSSEALDLFVKAVNDSEELGPVLIKRFLGNGSTAFAFETSDGDVLKLSSGSHFPQGRPHENFDVPIKKHGKVGKVHYYVEEMLSQHDMPAYFVNLVIEKIENAGYKPTDLSEGDIHQIGMSKDGELYLLDPECARYKTVFHALWHRVKRFAGRI